MQIRVLNKQLHFDHDLQKFRSTAFEPSSDGGLSVFTRDCGIDLSESICNHITLKYGDIAGDPSIYWNFDPSLIGNVVLKAEGNESDPCHHNIRSALPEENVRKFKERCKKFFKLHQEQNKLKEFVTCIIE